MSTSEVVPSIAMITLKKQIAQFPTVERRALRRCIAKIYENAMIAQGQLASLHTHLETICESKSVRSIRKIDELLVCASIGLSTIQDVSEDLGELEYLLSDADPDLGA